MKKVLLVSIVMFLLTASVAGAAQFTGLLGGANGYLSSNIGVSAFFNAHAGQQLAVGGFSTNVIGFCGLSTISNPTQFLILGFVPAQTLFITAPYTDLYLFTCVRYSGISDYIIIGAVNNSIAGMSAIQIYNGNQIIQELVDRLTEEVNKIVIK